MSEAAPDRAPVPNGQVTDIGHRLVQKRPAVANHVGVLQGSVAGERPEHQGSVLVHVQIVEPVDSVEIDQRGRGCQPEVEHRTEALTAGQQLRLLAKARQQTDRLLDAPGGVVGERRGFHALAPLAVHATFGEVAVMCWLLTVNRIIVCAAQNRPQPSLARHKTQRVA